MSFIRIVFSLIGIREILVILLFSVFIKWVSAYLKNQQVFKEILNLKGPKAWPIIGNALLFFWAKDTGDILKRINEILVEYPPPTRLLFGPHLFYLTTNPDEWKIILNHPAAYQKSDMYKCLKPMGGDGLFTADVHHWRKMRKIIMPTFNQQILNSFVPVFVEKGIELAEDFRKHCDNGYVDILHLVNERTVEIICETAMGLDGHVEESSHTYGPLASRCLEIAFLRIFQLFYQIDFIYKFTSLAKEERNILKKVKSFTATVVHKKRMAYERKIAENMNTIETDDDDDDGSKRKAFLDHLLDLSLESNITEKELLEETETFMVAGSDTTATMISFTLLMLGMHPDVQEKVYKEIIDVIGPEKAVESADLPKFKYMEMVIKETMRLFPVAPIISRTLESNIKIGSFTLPAGLEVVFPILNVHRSEKFWPDPLKFDPERFRPEQIAKRHPYTWIPFSAGPRNCIGLKYGMMSMKTMVATIIRKYKLGASYKSIEEISLGANLVLKPNDGHNCSITLRK